MANVLNSWKEIAAYLGRGVRTAQRWERDLALPVRRPRGRDRSAVFAVPQELDVWLKRCPARALADSTAMLTERPARAMQVTNGNGEKHPVHRWEIIGKSAEKLARGTDTLRGRTLELQRQVERAIVLGEKLRVQHQRWSNSEAVQFGGRQSVSQGKG